MLTVILWILGVLGWLLMALVVLAFVRVDRQAREAWELLWAAENREGKLKLAVDEMAAGVAEERRKWHGEVKVLRHELQRAREAVRSRLVLEGGRA